MDNVNMSTNDTVITVSARLRKSTHRAAKLKAFDEGLKLSELYDKAIRKYIGIEDQSKEGNEK
jgi:hypothetical protein